MEPLRLSDLDGSEPITIPTPIKVCTLTQDADLESDYAVSPHTPLLSTAMEENCFACGRNNAGQLGVGAQGDVLEPQPVQGVRPWALVSFGAYHACGVSCDGELWSWGVSNKGQLGHQDVESRELPEIIDELRDQQVKNVACGYEHTVAVTEHDVYSWGSNEHEQLGQDDGNKGQLDIPRRIRALHDKMVTHVVCGKHHTLAVTAQSHVYAWGANNHGQLGLGDRIDRRAPTIIESLWALPVKQLAAGDHHSCALTRSGYLFTWGLNQQGQLGQPPDAEHAAIQASSRGGSSRRKVSKRVNQKHLSVMLEMGIPKEKAELALIETKNVGVELATEWLFAKPENVIERATPAEAAPPAQDDKQNETLDDKSVLVPRRVPLKSVRFIAAGSHHCVAVTQHAVYSWGAGEHGQLGLDDFSSRDLPTKITTLEKKNLIQVACGTSHTVFLTREGDIYGMGANDCGQLGQVDDADNEASCYATPVSLKLPFLPVKQHRSQRKQPLVVRISAGENSSSFLTSSPDEIPEPSPTGLWEKLQGSIQGVQESERHPTMEYNSLMRQLTVAIELVFGSAAALSATFGYDDHVGMNVQKLNQVQKEILSLCTDKYLSDPCPKVLQSMDDLCSMSVYQAMTKAATYLVEDLYAHLKLLYSPERAQVLLAAIQHPLLNEPTFAKALLPRLCQTVLNAPHGGRHLLIKWWAEYPRALLEDGVIKPLQNYVTKELMATKKLTVNVMNAIKVLAKVEEANDIGRKLPPESFYNQLISEKMDVLDHYIAWRQSHDHPQKRSGQDGPFSFCSYPFLLDARAKSKLLHMEAKLQMEQTVAQSRLENVYGPFKKSRRENDDARVLPERKLKIKAEDQEHKKKRPNTAETGRARFRRGESSNGLRGLIYNILRTSHNDRMGDEDAEGGTSEKSDSSLARAGSLQLPRPEDSDIPATHMDMCIIRVRRNHLVEDALNEIARQFRKDLFKPLRVQFIGEEGIDVGGVKKEFFQLLVHDLLSPDYGMLVYQSESKSYWFNPGLMLQGEKCEDEFFLIGLVLGLAVYNGVLLDFPLPLVLYKKLLNQEVTLRDLEEMQPTVGRSLRQLLQYDGPGSVEDVFCQTMSIDVDVFGEIKSTPLKPNGEDIVVTEENRREYVDLYVAHALVQSIQGPFEAFSKGLRTICGGPAIQLFNAQELERLVCGNPRLDFTALENNARYDGGFTKDSQTVKWLWEIVSEFSMEHKKLLLKFFTGSDRAPIGGLGNLKCVIQRNGTDNKKLPTSHTCFNTLLLPECTSKEDLLQRLQLAIMNAEGFGLE